MLTRASVPLMARINTPSTCSYVLSNRGHHPFTSERTPLSLDYEGQATWGEPHDSVSPATQSLRSRVQSISWGGGMGAVGWGVALLPCGRLASQQMRISCGAGAGVSVSVRVTRDDESHAGVSGPG